MNDSVRPAEIRAALEKMREAAAKVAEERETKYCEGMSAVDVRLSYQTSDKYQDGRKIATAIRAISIDSIELEGRFASQILDGGNMTAAPLDIDALEAKMAAATPAPWQFSPWHIEEGPSAVRAPEGWVVASTSSDANAELIAVLRNAAPALFAAARERDKLRADIETMKERYARWQIEATKMDDQNAEITRLREALEAAEVFIAEEIKNRISQWPSFTEAVCDPAGALAKARAALGLSSALGAEAPSLHSPDPDR